MGKLRVLSGEAICAILRSADFIEIRQRGSHVIMQKATTNSTITVPVPNHAEIRIGVLQSIIRQSGLPRYLFENEP